jgi:hypothetical protein
VFWVFKLLFSEFMVTLKSPEGEVFGLSEEYAEGLFGLCKLGSAALLGLSAV